MTPKASGYKSFPPAAGPVGFSEVAPGQGHLLPTPPDILGPFYKAYAPWRINLLDYPDLYLVGGVYDRDGRPVDGAVIEFWQADKTGQYDNAGFAFRCRQAVSMVGQYRLETTKPGYYDISEPTDPEPHEFRCSHIHAMITAPGFNRQTVSGPGIVGSIKVALLTQLYFADSKYDDTDHWFDARRCVKPVPGDPARVMFDFVLEKE